MHVARALAALAGRRQVRGPLLPLLPLQHALQLRVHGLHDGAEVGEALPLLLLLFLLLLLLLLRLLLLQMPCQHSSASCPSSASFHVPSLIRNPNAPPVHPAP